MSFSSGYFLKTIVKHFYRKLLIYCGVIGFFFFFNDESILVLSWVFTDDTLTCCEMICGVVT